MRVEYDNEVSCYNKIKRSKHLNKIVFCGCFSLMIILAIVLVIIFSVNDKCDANAYTDTNGQCKPCNGMPIIDNNVLKCSQYCENDPAFYKDSNDQCLCTSNIELSGTSYCSHTRTNGNLRLLNAIQLADGTTYGFSKIYHQDQWWYIRHYYYDSNSQEAFCRLMGFPSSIASRFYHPPLYLQKPTDNKAFNVACY